jgi:hypothetical protein
MAATISCEMIGVPISDQFAKASRRGRGLRRITRSVAEPTPIGSAPAGTDCRDHHYRTVPLVEQPRAAHSDGPSRVQLMKSSEYAAYVAAHIVLVQLSGKHLQEFQVNRYLGLFPCE